VTFIVTFEDYMGLWAKIGYNIH